MSVGGPRPEPVSKTLPPLPNATKYDTIVTRFAPNPDFVLHLGSIRAIILSHDYAKMYKGQFLLRFDDTDPRLKKSAIEFYEAIREDLRWLECQWDHEYIASDRIPIYYEYAEKVIASGDAYICTCPPEDFRLNINAGRPCPDRSKGPDQNMSDWTKMLNGAFKEGEAVLRVKADLDHPNPAVRDWPALRIIDPEKYPHPRVGSKYRVWPLFAFGSAIDDHLLGVTHVIRGKEHLTNAVRTEFLYEALGWTLQDYVHYGRIKAPDIKLSKSLMVKEVEEGLVDGFSDPRLPTLVALRRRGYVPSALRKVVYEMGPRPVDATLSWENVNATNRKEIDKIAHRFSFLADPVGISVSGVDHIFEAHLALHPEKPEIGDRTLKVVPVNGIANLLVSARDTDLIRKSKVVRLMELFNVEVKTVEKNSIAATFHSVDYMKAREVKAPLVNWLPDENNMVGEVVMPDASRILGPIESNIRSEKVGSIIQMVRFGFGRIDASTGEKVTVYYAHR
ncbi:MAG TPA: glutamate--tRNA ligase [Candidatus Bathyarchaeia archaeon]|nr:glutamate--tRNA ligase [Candidatus Bathyarchaeia archaeon]